MQNEISYATGLERDRHSQSIMIAIVGDPIRELPVSRYHVKFQYFIWTFAKLLHLEIFSWFITAIHGWSESVFHSSCHLRLSTICLFAVCYPSCSLQHAVADSAEFMTVLL